MEVSSLVLKMVWYGICLIGMIGMGMLVWLRRCFRRDRLKYHQRSHSNNKSHRSKSKKKVIGFFHPRCMGGGGGERVLWKAMEALEPLLRTNSTSTNSPNGDEYYYRVVIFSIDPYRETYKEDLIRHVKERFDIELPISFDWSVIHLENVREDQLSPSKSWTMVMDSYRDMCWAWQALVQCNDNDNENDDNVEVFFDTTGCAFAFAVVKWIANNHIRVAAYVHYPTISTDMLQLVFQRRPTYNNASSVTQSILYTYIKLIYYAAFAVTYGLIGSLADCVMVNSTWTYNHIHYLWKGLSTYKLSIVYPPCDVPNITTTSTNTVNRKNWILSIAQFRPEKDHALQLRSFAKYIHLYENNTNHENENENENEVEDVKLILMGSCRNEQDEDRVKQLKQLAQQLHVQDRVQFVCNASYATLQQYMKEQATVGLHTMWNEHFGIGVVEMMAAGLITIAHNSGGPASDIITHNVNGYLATTEQQYADAIHTALQHGPNSPTNQSIQKQAFSSVQRFSDAKFITSFQNSIKKSNILTN